MRVIVAGSRHWQDSRIIHVVLDGFGWYDGEPLTVLDGGAPGADHIARTWRADGQGAVVHEHYDADWPPAGSPYWMQVKAAHDRNQRMVDARPISDVFLGFKDGFDWTLKKGGTEDVAKRAKAAGIRGYIVSTL